MNAIVVLGVCEGMIIWVVATDIPFGICLLKVGSGCARAGCVVCLGCVCVIIYYEFHLNKNLINNSFIMYISHGELL